MTSINRILAAAAFAAAFGLSMSGTWAIMDWMDTQNNSVTVVVKQPSVRLPVPHVPYLPQNRWREYDV